MPGEYLSYRQLVRRIRRVAHEELPPGATVIVVSRGDEALLELGEERRGWHFPQGKDGAFYAGYYPADSTEAVAHLGAAAVQGRRLFPAPSRDLPLVVGSLPWGSGAPGAAASGPLVQEEGTCLIFDLRKRLVGNSGPHPAHPSELKSTTRRQRPEQSSAMMGRPRNDGCVCLSAQGRTGIWRAALGQVQGRIRVLDEERREARREVAEIREEHRFSQSRNIGGTGRGGSRSFRGANKSYVPCFSMPTTSSCGARRRSR